MKKDVVAIGELLIDFTENGKSAQENPMMEALKEVGIGTQGLKFDSEIHTTLAFVHTKEDGDREFSFYRNTGADMMLSEEDLEETLLMDCKILHFGSLPITHKPCRKATKKAIELTKANGAILCFDPNLREPLCKSLEKAKEQIAKV